MGPAPIPTIPTSTDLVPISKITPHAPHLSVVWNKLPDTFNSGRLGEAQFIEYRVTVYFLIAGIGLLFLLIVGSCIYHCVAPRPSEAVSRLLGPQLAIGCPVAAAIMAVTMPRQPKNDPEELFHIIADIRRARLAEQNNTLSGGVGEHMLAPGKRKGKVGGWW